VRQSEQQKTETSSFTSRTTHYYEILGERVAKAIKASNNERGVFVMEWNYPISSNASGLLPSLADFSDARQVACINATFEAVLANGGMGFMFFEFFEATGIEPPPGGYSPLDLKALQVMRDIQLDDFLPFDILEWFEDGVHLDYLQHRLPLLLKGLGKGQGILHEGGAKRPGYYELQRIFQQHSRKK
jgi:hypothetical protein